MLRNYDKIGLLKPEQVDDLNGYRYYGERQVVEANRIQILKSLGFGLKEIPEMLQSGILDDTIKTFLTNKIIEKKRSLEETKRQIMKMQKAIKELEDQNDCALSVSVKKFPTRKVVSLRGIIHEFSEEGLLWDRLAKECNNHDIRLADVPYCFAITHSVDFEKKHIDTEVLRVVEKIMPETDGLRFSEMCETKVASIAYQGIYSRIGDINKYIYHWIEENGYKICGRAFQVYYISPDNETNPEKFITEVCFPIK
ncbi:MAG: MerR family transcriptional regulator [Bacillota bacterium]|nr:MerR family transcriptional regulator [Bacillota bacterium]